jgi:hypothetical protein
MFQGVCTDSIIRDDGGRGITLIMEAIQTSETLVNSYQSTWRYNPEDSHLRTYFCTKSLENAIFH